MKLIGVTAIILLVIFTISMAQIRYALLNPLNSMDVLLGIGVEIALIAYISYHYFVEGKNFSNPITNYNLAGVKGGKATRRKSRRAKLQ